MKLTQDDIVLTGRRAIEKEATALAEFTNTLDDSFSQACKIIFGCEGTVVLSGMGKSGIVGRKWASTFASTGTKSYFINPAEASHGDLGMIRQGDVLVALSYSGETDELSPVIRHAKENSIPRIAITGNLNSSLAKHSDVTLSVFTLKEACPLNLAPTTSTTVMMALGDALAITLMQMRGFTETDFARLHPGGSLGRRLWLRVTDLMHSGEAIPKVNPTAGWQEVLLVMTEKRLGLAVVMSGEEILGIITDGDLRRFLQKRQFNTDVQAKDMMTVNPRTIASNALGVEAREVMEQSTIQQLLVVDENSKLVGVVHFHDLLKRKVL